MCNERKDYIAKIVKINFVQYIVSQLRHLSHKNDFDIYFFDILESATIKFYVNFYVPNILRKKEEEQLSLFTTLN